MIGLVLMIGALVVETSLFTIHLSQVDMKKEKEVKKNLARDNQERFNGGYPCFLSSFFSFVFIIYFIYFCLFIFVHSSFFFLLLLFFFF